jgi:hypothetical protein
MSTFAVTKTVVKPTDTVEKFEKKVKNAKLDTKMVAKFLEEIDRKEGVWGSDRCFEIRDYLEGYDCEEE